MKLAVFGLTLSSSWENGHATLWRGLCRARRDATDSDMAMVTSYCPDGISATSLVLDAAAVSGGPLAVFYALDRLFLEPARRLADRRPARRTWTSAGIQNVEPQKEKVRA